jgi:hypothetical protein
MRAGTGGTLVSRDDRAALRLARTDPGGLLAAYVRPLFFDRREPLGDRLVALPIAALWAP